MEYLPLPEDLLELLPGAAAACVLLVIAALLDRRGAKAAPAVAGLAFGAAHVVSFWWTRGLPAFPAVQSSQRGFYAVAGCTVITGTSARVRSAPALVTIPHLESTTIS